MKNTLQDLNVFLHPKQKGMLNTLIEENPLLASVPVKPASHGIYNVYAKATNIDGMEEVDFDAELPTVGISFELGRTRLGKIGGKLPIPQDAALEVGGYGKYAEARLPSLIAEAGNAQETRIYYKGLLKAALNNSKCINCGGTTANKQFSLVAVTWNMDSTVGLYDPNYKSNGKVFEQLVLNGGNEYEIEVDNKKCIGKMIACYLKFGLQLADERLVGGIVNIEPSQNTTDRDKIDGLPTAAQMEDLLAGVRAGANTVIYCHPVLQKKLAAKFNLGQRVVGNGTNNVAYNFYDFQGIPVVASYNIAWGTEAVVSL